MSRKNSLADLFEVMSDETALTPLRGQAVLPEPAAPAPPPSWLDVARPHLLAINGRNKIKKRNTVLDFAISQMLNTKMEWGRGSSHCARSTWLDVWRHEPQVKRALTAVLDAIQAERMSEAGAAVDAALLALQLAAPDAAETLIRLLTETRSAKVLRLVANSILDRASKKTAPAQEAVEIPGLETALAKIFGDEGGVNGRFYANFTAATGE